MQRLIVRKVIEYDVTTHIDDWKTISKMLDTQPMDWVFDTIREIRSSIEFEEFDEKLL